MKRYGFLVCFLITLILAVLLELTRIWVLLIVAGVIGGFLSKSFLRAVFAGCLGVLVCWLLYIAVFYTLNPYGMGIALSVFSLFLGLMVVLGAVLGALSASLGYFLSQVLMPSEKGSGK